MKRERKVLIIKSKDGMTVDLDDLRRSRADKVAAVESAPVPSPPSDHSSATTTGGEASESSSPASASSLNHDSNVSDLSGGGGGGGGASSDDADTVEVHDSSSSAESDSNDTDAVIATSEVSLMETGTVDAATDSSTDPTALSSDVLPLPSSSDVAVFDGNTSLSTAAIMPVTEEVVSLEQLTSITDEGYASQAQSTLESSADPYTTLESTATVALQAPTIVSDEENPSSSSDIMLSVSADKQTTPPPSSSSSSSSEQSSIPDDITSASNVTATSEEKAPILTIESTFVAMVIAPPVENEVPSFPVYIAPSVSLGIRGGKSPSDADNSTKGLLHKKSGPSSDAPLYVNPSLAMPTRSKKSQRKEMFASADALGATADEDSMLSAYTAISKATDAPVPLNSIVLSTHKTAAVASSSSETIVEVASSTVDDSEVVDSWEDTVEDTVVTDQSSIPVKAVQEPTVKRSLRPGGSSMLMRLNQAPAVIRFTKQELLNLKPTSRPQLNPLSLKFVNISTGESLHPSSMNSSGKMMNSNSPLWGKGKQQAHSSSSHHHQQQQQQASVDSADGSAWKRESSMLSGQNLKGAKGKGGSMSVPMPPRKVISDPVEMLTTECISILNKITPQTYDKLSQSILELNITNTAMMDKLIQLIFEKAVQEQSFAHLYAELCFFLSKNAAHWTFYTIVRDVDVKDTNYFWIVDHEFSSVAAGPFFSKNDCSSAIQSEVPKPMNPINVASFEVVETIVMNSIILRIYRNEKSKEYFVTYLPLNDIPLAERSTEVFIDDKTASTDARNKYSFRARLLSSCQQEFQKTTQYVRISVS